MRGINKALVAGHLGRDPEVRFTQAGQATVTLSVATSESWLDKNSGQRQERTEWHRVVLWGKDAENAGKYLKKGSSVFVEGRIQTREWQDKEGQKRTSVEIVASSIHYLDGPTKHEDSADEAPRASTPVRQQPAAPKAVPPQRKSFIDDDEPLPF